VLGDSVPTDLIEASVHVEVGGRRIVQSFQPQANQLATITWDGLDAFGRPMQGAQVANVLLEYVYPRLYAVPDTVVASGSFGLSCRGTAGAGMSVCVFTDALSNPRHRFAHTAGETIHLGGWDAREAGIGGWSLDVHHAYNPMAKVVYFGDGRQRKSDPAQPIVSNFAGSPTAEGYAGDGGPAINALLNEPRGLAVGPDGSVYIAEFDNDRVRRVAPDGVITTVAGNGQQGYAGDGGAATSAQLNDPWGVAVASDGSLFIGERARIRKVNTAGVITTIAGNGTQGFGGDGGPASDATLTWARLLKFGPDGSLYFVDASLAFAQRIRRIAPDGIINTVAGSGGSCEVFVNWPDCHDGGPAVQAAFYQILGLAVSANGPLFISDGNHLVRRVSQDGEIRVIAGVPGEYEFNGDGLPADSTNLDVPEGIVATRDGRVLFADAFGIRQIDSRGRITRIMGQAANCSLIEDPSCGDGGLAGAAKLLFDVWDMVEGPDGSLYFIDRRRRVRRVAPWLPPVGATEHRVASDDGAQLYVFDSNGRHQETRNTLTGSLVWRFHYDSAERLLQIEDADSLITEIERDVDETPTAIVGPYGQRTEPEHRFERLPCSSQESDFGYRPFGVWRRRAPVVADRCTRSREDV
jgi:YD repeat-containing protein